MKSMQNGKYARACAGLAALAMIAFARVPDAGAAVFTVTNAANSGAGTLRAAITNANAAGAGVHTIAFAIPAPHRIVVTNPLPQVTNNAVMVDGSTQAGYVGEPLVEIVGQYGVTDAGLRFWGPNGGARALRLSGFSNSTFAVELNGLSNRVFGCWIMSNYAGLVVSTFGSHAMIGGGGATNRNVFFANQNVAVQLVGTAGRNVVAGNYVGLDPGGVKGITGQVFGIVVSCSSNRIGGTTSGDRNVVSGHSTAILLTTTNAVGNVVQGNYVGTDAAGLCIVTNGIGIRIFDARGNTIGGAAVDARNHIVGSSQEGLSVMGAPSVQNVIQNNFVGVGPTSNALANGVFAASGGISLLASSNTILFNVISANIGPGVDILAGSQGNILAGNVIGLDPSGDALMGNSGSGVRISSASSNVIGSLLFPNIFSGNGLRGIQIVGPGADGNVVVNNRIGTDITGRLPRGNSVGVDLQDARGTVVGNAASGGNLISGNLQYGILVTGANGENNSFDFNFIGVDASGTNGLANGISGMLVLGGRDLRLGVQGRNIVSGHPAKGIEIGTSATNIVIAGNYVGIAADGVKAIGNNIGISVQNFTGAGLLISNNVVSGSGASGVMLNHVVASNLVIAGNVMGLAADGATVASNGQHGIEIIATPSAMIGGAVAAARNVISGNGGSGIRLINAGSNGAVTIAGNYIGLNAAGSAAPGNGADGIYGSLSPNVQVGGPVSAWRNVIAGNENGIRNENAGARWWIANNIIGMDPSGISARSNRSFGIRIQQGAVSNTIESNIIANNGSGGVFVSDGSTGAVVRANRIGMGTFSFVPMPNGGPGIWVWNSSDGLYGGFSTNDANRIAYNLGQGVRITGAVSPVRNAILGNVIYSNALMGIDLNDDGYTPNDSAPDADTGLANHLQNHPELIAASAGATNITGRFIGAPGPIRLEFFALTPSAGMIFLGATNHISPPTGTSLFAAAFSTVAPAGSRITATATSDDGTSEFAPVILVSGDPDTDGDGMPDWWESSFGLNPAVSNAPTADADGDGFADVQEWIAGTEPNNASAFLRITSISGQGLRTLQFPSTSARRYALEATTSLVTSTWFVLQENLPGLDGSTQVADSSIDPVLMYRIHARLP